MAYIGHSASGNFTTKPSKDTFSGDGSTTAFTLSEGATTNTVDVFVENVRQEPTTAYTVDGTTLTFTAAPGSGTNNIYVVNRGPLQLSATHPAAQALEASTGTFTGDLTVDTNTLHVDSTNNRVGIGTSTPEHELVVKNTTTDPTVRIHSSTDSGASPAIELMRGTNDTFGADAYGDFRVSNNAGTLRFERGVNGTTTEHIRILAGGGLTFNGDTAAANALNDYEEGSWTPVIADAASGGNTASTSSSNGYYTKVGSLVTANFTIVNINTTGMTGTAGIYIRGLPFVMENVSNNTSCASVIADQFDIAIDTCYGMNSRLSPGDDYLRLLINRDAVGDLLVKVNQIISGAADIIGTIVYRT